MRRTILSGLASIALLAGAVGAAEAAVCATPKEEVALEMRVLQSELMVAALTCQQRDSYNAFAIKFRNDIKKHGKVLRGFFKRHYGSRSKKRLDRFVTRVANESSQRSMQAAGSYCADSDALFRQVLGMEGRHLPVFAAAQTFAVTHGVEACTESAAAQ